MISSDLPVRFDADGLIPAVIQDAQSDAVLMLGFMNEEALALTLSTGFTHYWSRSRQKIWKKGETSGNTQSVVDVRVNCEENSLLLKVIQTSAVCHTGYPTCFYRRIDVDGSLSIIEEQVFDPADVYGEQKASSVATWLGAFAYLKDKVDPAVSGSAQILQDPDFPITERIADELGELAGVLLGEHRHSGLPDDLITEGSQSLYWLAMLSTRDGLNLNPASFRQALSTPSEEATTALLSSLMARTGATWRTASGSAAEVLATVALIGQAMSASGIDPMALIESDLQEMRGRAYLASYFEQSGL